MANRLIVRTDYCRKGEDVKAQPRHVGLYYWCAYWGFWDRVLRTDGTRVLVVKVDLSGQPVEAPRWHMTAMNSCAFAERPFVVSRRA